MGQDDLYGSFNYGMGQNTSDPNSWTVTGGDTGSNSGGGYDSSGDMLKNLSYAAQLAKALQSFKGGKWIQPPMSPEQKEMFNWSMNRVKGLPDANNTLFPIAMAHVVNGSKLDIGAMKNGQVGYTPGNYDVGSLSDILKKAYSNNGPTTAPTGTPSGPPTAPPAGSGNGSMGGANSATSPYWETPSDPAYGHQPGAAHGGFNQDPNNNGPSKEFGDTGTIPQPTFGNSSVADENAAIRQAMGAGSGQQQGSGGNAGSSPMNDPQTAHGITTLWHAVSSFLSNHPNAGMQGASIAAAGLAASLGLASLPAAVLGMVVKGAYNWWASHQNGGH